MSDFSETRIQFRRGTSAAWIASNPILASGEPGYDVDNKIFKIGDGTTSWDELEEITGSGGGVGLSESEVVTIVNSGISDVIDQAPEFLNTLNEISAAIGDNPDFISTFNTVSGVAFYASGNALYNISEDTTPQLGGDLDLNNNDIIGTGNITANSGNFDQINFNTSLGEPDLSAGQFAWYQNEGTLALGVSDTYAMFVGEELHYCVRNNTGSTILAGTPVYASDITDGGNPRIIVSPYIADGSIRELYFMGLATEDVDSGLNGYTTHFGYIRKIDTRGDASSNGTTNKLWAAGEPAWAEGDILYVHPTVAGKVTKIEPKHSISVAIILNRHENDGKIFVRPTSYGHLDDNHDVALSGVAHNDVLVYNSGTAVWENNDKVIFSDTSNIVGASGVNNIVKISQSDFDNIVSPDPNTIFFIV